MTQFPNRYPLPLHSLFRLRILSRNDENYSSEHYEIMNDRAKGEYHLHIKAISLAHDNGQFYCSVMDMATKTQISSRAADVVVMSKSTGTRPHLFFKQGWLSMGLNDILDGQLLSYCKVMHRPCYATCAPHREAGIMGLPIAMCEKSARSLPGSRQKEH